MLVEVRGMVVDLPEELATALLERGEVRRSSAQLEHRDGSSSTPTHRSPAPVTESRRRRSPEA